jgi:hypothetical protein
MFLDVWIMKEYGNKESWTKLYWVPLMSRLYNKTLYIFEDDQLLIDFYDSDHMLKLIVYDSKNRTSKILEIQDINYRIKPEVYIESLISP